MPSGTISNWGKVLFMINKWTSVLAFPSHPNWWEQMARVGVGSRLLHTGEFFPGHCRFIHALPDAYGCDLALCKYELIDWLTGLWGQTGFDLSLCPSRESVLKKETKKEGPGFLAGQSKSLENPAKSEEQSHASYISFTRRDKRFAVHPWGWFKADRRQKGLLIFSCMV